MAYLSGEALFYITDYQKVNPWPILYDRISSYWFFLDYLIRVIWTRPAAYFESTCYMCFVITIPSRYSCSRSASLNIMPNSLFSCYEVVLIAFVLTEIYILEILSVRMWYDITFSGSDCKVINMLSECSYSLELVRFFNKT